jgi:hypothetical protein
LTITVFIFCVFEMSERGSASSRTTCQYVRRDALNARILAE